MIQWASVCIEGWVWWARISYLCKRIGVRCSMVFHLSMHANLCSLFVHDDPNRWMIFEGLLIVPVTSQECRKRSLKYMDMVWCPICVHALEVLHVVWIISNDILPLSMKLGCVCVCHVVFSIVRASVWMVVVVVEIRLVSTECGELQWRRKVSNVCQCVLYFANFVW